jgi:ankyrin repeat protein
MSLYGALLTGRYSKARRLIGRRAGINTPGEDGETPLMLTAQHPDMVDLTRLLLLAGADVNARNIHGETPLLPALWRPNNRENVSLLIEQGADTGVVTAYGYRARDCALSDAGVAFDDLFPENSGRRTILKMAATADATSLEKVCREQHDDTVLLQMLLNNAVHDEDCERVALLLEMGIPADTPSKYGETLLMFAACRTNTDLVKLLLHFGANPTHRDYMGLTACMKIKICAPGWQKTELLYGEYALEQLGRERMEEIVAVQREIERLLDSVTTRDDFYGKISGANNHDY